MPHMPRNPDELIGKTFGCFMVVASSKTVGSKKGLWLCRCIKCGNTYKRGIKEIVKNRIGCRQCSRDPRAALKANYQIYKYQAEKRRLAFNLSEEQFIDITLQDCVYCGDKPSRLIGGSTKWLVNGVDRTDNTLGYAPTNVVPCCRRCNMAKGQMSNSEFLRWISKVYTHNLSKRVDKAA
jgi:hypothetical protein